MVSLSQTIENVVKVWFCVQATTLNSIVAQAFAIAYANKQADSEKQSLTTFHDVIQSQLEAFRERFEENSKQKQNILAKSLSQMSSTPHAQQDKERHHKEQEDSEHVRRRCSN